MKINKLTKILQFGLSFSPKRYHQILGVSSTASSEQIKSAYYRMAKIHHPDINPASGAGMKFNQIRNAYEQLMKTSSANPYIHKQKEKENKKQPKRQSNNNRQKQQKSGKAQDFQQKYESFYQQTFRQRQDPYIDMQQEQFKQFQKAFHSFLRDGYLRPKYMKFKPYFDQLFQNLGPQSHNYQKNNKKKKKQKIQEQESQDESIDEQYQEQFQQNNRRKKRSKSTVKKKHRLKKLDISYQLQIKESEVGQAKKIKILRQVICNKCHLSSNQNLKKQICKRCQKDKNLSDNCPKCFGKGFITKNNCKTCQNKGYLKKLVQQYVIVPANMSDQGLLVMEGRGHQHRRKGHFGDLVINVSIISSQSSDTKQKKRNKFKQEYIQISIFQAVLGCITTVKTQKGLSQVKIPAGIQYGDQIKNNKDFRKVKVNFTIPQNISNQQRIIYQKLRKLNHKQSQQ